MTDPVIKAPDGVASPGQAGSKQGYMVAECRPSCHNCWAGPKANIPSKVCGYGGFVVELNGWCPFWIPDAPWINNNRQAARLLGLELGRGPAKASDKPDDAEALTA